MLHQGPSGRNGIAAAEVDGYDRRILELLESVACPLCPPSIAVNVRSSPTDARVRCQKLHGLGLLDTEERGRKAFTLSTTGEDFVAGNVTVESLRWR
ncbi:hypothetical protein N0B31_20735 [Salinirubellus salinus]|jgi:L-fucose mutarotase/ribose pyranase (RbsD/FucU family)|uniref:Uncharacterized protein n=1 Tax=Salinirubellus salinus TaxID=1364945 RepID=A0A9E7R4J6_9EURY|nr:hypothetical protein [Salinirubellus salinus]UWM54535.1 hypothetical protein N0B31_20735 [Salinirubellus salinus]